MDRTAFEAAMKIYRMLPREVCMYIGFEVPVRDFETIIQAAIDKAMNDAGNTEPAPAGGERGSD